MQNVTETEKEAAIARSQRHADELNALLQKRSTRAVDKIAIATLALGKIELTPGIFVSTLVDVSPRAQDILLSDRIVETANYHLYFMNTEQKAVIAIGILREIFEPSEPEDDENDETFEPRINEALRKA